MTRAPALVLIITTLATWGLLSLALAQGRAAGSTYHTPAWVLILHLASVIPTVPLGAYVLLTRKGDARHRLLGRIWGVLMLITAITSFWVRSITGGISPIHLFSVLTLFSVPMAVWHIRRGNRIAHQRAMTFTYIGLIVAGLFALLPGRWIGNLLFG